MVNNFGAILYYSWYLVYLDAYTYELQIQPCMVRFLIFTCITETCIRPLILFVYDTILKLLGDYAYIYLVILPHILAQLWH